MEYTFQDALDNHQHETEADEMPGGCMLDTHDDSGEQDGYPGAGKSDVSKGKQRMVTCEEVEDEDMVRRPKVDSTDEEDESEDEFHSFDEDEDEDESEGSDEDDSEYEDEENDENELQIQSGILWRCEICRTTVNIFGREDHLRSRAHLRNTGGNKTHAAYGDLARSYTWRCTLCAEDMSVFHRADHLASKPHLKAVVQHRDSSTGNTTPEEFANLPALARSSSFDFRKTFYCITCAAEFDSSEQAQHLATSMIWNCEVCATRMHPAVRAQHLDSEAHAVAKRQSKAPDGEFLCIVCERMYNLGESVDHFAGTEHRTMLARKRLEKLYLEKQQAKSSKQRTAGKVEAPAETDGQQSNTKTPPPPASSSYCEVCNRHIDPSGMAGHRSGQKHMRKEAAKKKSSSNPTPGSQDTNWAIASAHHITVSGRMFHCALCSRDRYLVGIEGHINSLRHRKKMAAIEAH